MFSELPIAIPEEISGFVKHIRAQRNLSQADLARRLKVERQYIWNAENLDTYTKGHRGLTLLKRIAGGIDLNMREREHMEMMVLERTVGLGKALADFHKRWPKEQGE